MTITIDKVIYEVISESTNEAYPVMKADLARRGFVGTMTVKRPKGRKLSMAYKTASGSAVIVCTI